MMLPVFPLVHACHRPIHHSLHHVALHQNAPCQRQTLHRVRTAAARRTGTTLRHTPVPRMPCQVGSIAQCAGTRDCMSARMLTPVGKCRVRRRRRCAWPPSKSLHLIAADRISALHIAEGMRREWNAYLALCSAESRAIWQRHNLCQDQDRTLYSACI